MIVRSKIQMLLLVIAAVAGLFAQTSYLVIHFFGTESQSITLGSWHLWSVLLAWILAVFYLWFRWKKSETDIGLFVLPVVLILVLAAYGLSEENGFATSDSKSFWGPLHGFALLIGTVSVAMGAVFGLMYLIQAARLKAKMIRSSRFKLPSLEWLQNAIERSLLFSSVMLAFGVVSGIVLNIVNQSISSETNLQSITTIEWQEPVVWTSLLLFGWLIAVLIFNWVYTPARRGKKVAYLVLGSFAFLTIEIIVVLATQHASQSTALDHLPALSTQLMEESQ